MQDLRARLTISGFPNVSFRIIVSKPNYETETESMDILRSFAGDIPVIEESENFHPIWQSILEGEVDHILVLDRCGRLAFQVISPWSLLSYPYVKAAILSTYNDDPCGPCIATENEAEASYTVSAVDNSTITQTDPDSSEIQTTYTIEEQDYNLTHAIPSTTPLYSHNSQTTTATVEEQTMEMEENSTHETADSSLHNTVSSREELHINMVVRDKIMPKSPASVITEQSAYKDNMMEVHNIMDENELDATLSPLAERKDGSVPIRVIMRFPHHHTKNGTVSEYEYLVLQTGNPDYHGHLESDENQDLVLPDDNGYKKHLLENSKIHKGKKHHNSRKPVESEETDAIHEDKNIEKHKHKGSKHKNKIKHRDRGEIKDESNEEKSLEIKKNKGKIKVKKTETEVEQDSEERENSRGKNIHNRVNVAESEGIQETTEEIPHHSVTPEAEETREAGSTEENKHKGYDNSGMSHSNEEDGSTSEISQDIRKHGKHKSHHSGNTTHHLNMIKHVQKPDRHHNKHKVTVSVNTNVNGTDHVRKIKVNKKMHTGLNTNDTEGNVDTVTQDHTSENGSTQFIKKVELHKKKHRVPVLEDSVTTTPLPLPIVLYNVNKVNDSRPKQVIQNTMKGKLTPVFKNAYNTEGDENRLGEENRLEDEDNLQTLEQIDVITNIGKPNTSNRTQVETSNEENDSEGRDDNIIEHYSKLLKWIEYQL